jgi:hypothetical protein
VANNTDFKSKLMKFLSLSPEELMKAYPTIDPSKLVDQLNLQGMQQSGGMFAGMPTGDTGLLQQSQGAPTMGGQGFKMPADTPWTPQATAQAPFADVQANAQPGLKVPTEAMQPLMPGGANPMMNPLLIASLGKALMDPTAGRTPPPQAPGVNFTRAGGQPGQFVMQQPQTPDLQQQMLQSLLQRSLYG